MGKDKKAVVVGAGLVGALWAVFLAKRGYDVSVFEQRSDMRRAGYAGGRSINLAMSDRGWKAVEQAGIKEKLTQVAIPMYGRMMHSTSGELAFQPYGKDNQAIYSVSRGGLNLELLNIAAEFPNVKFFFDHKCRRFEPSEQAIWFEGPDDSLKKVEAPLIFGVDGAFSAIRNSLQRLPRFNYSQSYLDYGYKELAIPANEDGSHRLEKNALHIWPRGQFMLIGLPNVDGSFTCTLFLPFEGSEAAFDRLDSDQTVLAFFQKYFPDTIPLMPSLLDDFRQNPASALVTVRCNPWHYEDKVLLLGDAAHAIVPFFGQGMNAGFEDCTLLDEMIDTFDEDWGRIAAAFSASRIEDGNAIAELALRNFIEMRDLVADPKFLLRQKIAARLHEKHSDFLPLYSMVTFSNIPYSKALQAADEQNVLFNRILALPDIEQNWESNDQIDVIFQDWKQMHKGV
ncbi:MAG: FAD-dependent monooxygenase [Saprospiraceae bacterium]|nr:FAD-dependent monooxygenase [Saprospiraceae bacterium]